MMRGRRKVMVSLVNRRSRAQWWSAAGAVLRGAAVHLRVAVLRTPYNDCGLPTHISRLTQFSLSTGPCMRVVVYLGAPCVTSYEAQVTQANSPSSKALSLRMDRRADPHAAICVSHPVHAFFVGDFEVAGEPGLVPPLSADPPTAVDNLFPFPSPFLRAPCP